MLLVSGDNLLESIKFLSVVLRIFCILMADSTDYFFVLNFEVVYSFLDASLLLLDFLLCFLFLSSVRRSLFGFCFLTFSFSFLFGLGFCLFICLFLCRWFCIFRSFIVLLLFYFNLNGDIFLDGLVYILSGRCVQSDIDVGLLEFRKIVRMSSKNQDKSRFFSKVKSRLVILLFPLRNIGDEILLNNILSIEN